MKCQNGNCDNEATDHLTEIVNAIKKEKHFCEACSSTQLKSLKKPQNLDNLFFVIDPADKKKQTQILNACPACAWTYDDFRREGKFGCPQCYNVFVKEITPLLKRIHNDVRHRGKQPKKIADQQDSKLLVSQLREELQIAVREEDFEQAAKLRDQLRDLDTP